MAANRGEADVASVAELFADPTRARVLTALVDGRSLPASVLAAEAGVSPQAASSQLNRLREGGLIDVERSGRHRYYRLASAQVAVVLEALATMAPDRPVRSLREGTRAAALRQGRTCYDHLAGKLGVTMTSALVDRGVLVATDGEQSTARRPGDPLSSQLASHPYQLGPHAERVFTDLGLQPTRTGSRPMLRFCLDWSEQRHHLAGRLGAELLAHFFDKGWLVRRPQRRAVRLTESGATELEQRLGLRLDS